ncbi:MAG: hypothetical protein PHF25_04510 [Candidatus Margulisbacteria bacterium]|nr:hypothetical protein [Candidatus Margulisiibacteriota bacterium]
MINKNKEILEIVKVISNGKNALIYGSLYSGKTTFLKQLSAVLVKEKINYFFIDCKKCFDARSFLTEYSKEGLRVLSEKVAGAVKDAYQTLPNIKPSISSSGTKGAELTMSYSLTDDDISKFASDVLQAPYRISQSREEQVVVVLDNYENLMSIENLNLSGFIAKNIGKGVVYVLSTADQELFLAVNKKEQKKLAIDLVKTIERPTETQLKKNIQLQFKEQSIEEGAAQSLVSLLVGDLKAISECINFYGKKALTIKEIKKNVSLILEQKEQVFQLYFDSLSVHQKKLIIAIAKHTGQHVFKSQFIYNNGLISVPSVQTSIKGLIKKQFLHKDDAGLKITDVFFAEWLRRYF